MSQRFMFSHAAVREGMVKYAEYIEYNGRSHLSMCWTKMNHFSKWAKEPMFDIRIINHRSNSNYLNKSMCG